MRVLSSAANVGTYRIRNALVHEAQPHVVTIFDADDVMLPGHLAALLQVLSGGASVARTGFFNCNVDLTTRAPKVVAQGVFASTPGVWERIGWFRPLRVSADWDFHLRVDAAGITAGSTGTQTFLRRVHPNSLVRAPATRSRSPIRTAAGNVVRAAQPGYARGEGLVVPYEGVEWA